jgi:hypothetical protein
MDRKTDGQMDRWTQRYNKTSSGGQRDGQMDKEMGRQTDIVGGFGKTGKKACLTCTSCIIQPGKSYRRGRLSAVDLLVLTNLDQLIWY